MSELIDNRRHRIDTLKEIILHLHQGRPPEEVRARLEEIVRETDASEIAAMEQQLIDGGMSVDEVRSMCDLHSQVLRGIVRDPGSGRELPAGHPAETFGRENRAIADNVSVLRAVLTRVCALPSDGDPGDLVLKWREIQNRLMDLEKHYARKENLLFPMLERHGITGPSKVMWAKDDEVRDHLRAMNEALRENATAPEWAIVAEAVATPALDAVEEMITKEERILLPLALDVLTEEEWGEIWRESPRFGFCLVEPGRDYRAPEPAAPPPVAEIPPDRAITFPTGRLGLDQLRSMFTIRLVDLTFVDADDRVAFFSEGPDRVFARGTAVLGRKVQHCHPPRSVDTVEHILSDFRAGRQDVAEFWINLHGRFIHIRYFAVRDDAGLYMGTLEVTQDLTRPRALTGERRLLAYGDDATASADPGGARVSS